MTSNITEPHLPGASSGTPRQQPFDVVIIGGGVAGLSVALSLPDAWCVALVTKAALGESNTRYAQGGLAVAIGADDDPALHLRDTLAAGAGLVDETAARVLVEEGPEAVAWLIGVGAAFDPRAGREHEPPTSDPRSLAEHYALGREAAHSRWRVLHAHGDATGAEIERALVAAVHARPGLTVFEHTYAMELLVQEGACRGALVQQPDGATIALVATRATVLANGGAGQLWLRTSNPTGATADGIALAWRAGALLADLEFVQFHPTVLVPPSGGGDAFLISEAVRGEGAYLRNAAGQRFMPGYAPDAELAPRDVVARAILSEMLREGAPSAFLDLRHLDAAAMRARFPTIAAACAAQGLDLATDLIPVAPAAHYFMGGVAVDTWARATLPGLFAVGEAACTGVHGANRLASNSLLEGLVFGRRAAIAIAGTAPSPVPEGGFRGGTPSSRDFIRQVASSSRAEREPSPAISPLPGVTITPDILVPAVRAGDTAGAVRWALRRAMWERVSLRRDAAGLAEAARELRDLAAAGPVDTETANMLIAAQLITAAAQARTESRGGHYRTDHPAPDPARDGQHTLVAAPTCATPFVVTRGHPATAPSEARND